MQFDTFDDGGLKTWAASDAHGRVELVPGRGALVTRWVVDGEDVLFLDRETLLDPTKNVRGGIPLLFPFAGRSPIASLPQHGFARRLPWELVDATADDSQARVTCRLTSNAETKQSFPHDFRLEYSVSLLERRLLLEWAVTNAGVGPMPLHFGLHPYFRVPPATRAKARLLHHATRAWNNVSNVEQPVGAIDFTGPEVDLHLLDHPSSQVVFERGDGKQLTLSWTPQFSTLVTWALPGKDFVCVEPWTAPGGALTTGQGVLQLAPGSTERLAVQVAFE